MTFEAVTLRQFKVFVCFMLTTVPKILPLMERRQYFLLDTKGFIYKYLCLIGFVRTESYYGNKY